MPELHRVVAPTRGAGSAGLRVQARGGLGPYVLNGCYRLAHVCAIASEPVKQRARASMASHPVAFRDAVTLRFEHRPGGPEIQQPPDAQQLRETAAAVR